MNKHNAVFPVSFLWLVLLLLYFPVFLTPYAYTDEYVQLWYYGKVPEFRMFLEQGRVITDLLFRWLFGNIQSIGQITWIRMFSLAGWFLSIPIWYHLLKRITAREALPASLPFIITLYIICAPAVTISVCWASCLELFLANTMGFLSGYSFYAFLNTRQRRSRTAMGMLAGSLAAGLISLFTYQNGFGCFLIPFLMHLAGTGKNTRFVLKGIAGYLLMAGLYFLLFKYGLQWANVAASGRTKVQIMPFEKLRYFFTKPLSAAFQFSFLFNEKNYLRYLASFFVILAWFVRFWQRHKGRSVSNRLLHASFIFFILLLIYLPSLAVRENYASNRTLLAMCIGATLLTVEALQQYAGLRKKENLSMVVLAFVFFCSACYNINYLFLRPVRSEYHQLKAYLRQHYRPDTDTVYFIRPPEDLFVKQYAITRSWDEFGVPSSFFSWVPEHLVRQQVWDITGSRQAAERLVIQQWPELKAWSDAGIRPGPGALLIDAERLIEEGQ